VATVEEANPMNAVTTHNIAVPTAMVCHVDRGDRPLSSRPISRAAVDALIADCGFSTTLPTAPDCMIGKQMWR
jgi:hypothetical protein